MVDIYSKLRDTGILTGLSTGASVNFGMYADELVYFGSGVEPGLAFTNNILPASSITADYWNQSYHQVYCANAVIEGIQKSSSLSISNKNQLIGEALFVRALVHFYLVNIYGGIPYITTTDYEQNRLEKRIPTDEVYSHIIGDLNLAASLLSDQYVSQERVRPNRSAVYALLARTYLYNQQWAEAADAASAVLNNQAYTLENDLDQTFLKESRSTIFQFMPKLDGNNTDEGTSFIFISGSSSFVALSAELINSFQTGDQRRSHWIRAVTEGADTWYHSFKYKQNSNTGSSEEYSIVFRIAEQYLIRAEARARQGDLIGAKEDLNKVRNTAGLANTPAITANEIITAVLSERRFEFFTEYGHRFFDLKRTGQLDAVLSITKPGWETTDQLWPLPETELIANPLLGSQNPGY
nr:RagB/SusD family nutrient uptake outer membrane protein [Flavobacterium sp. 1355]